MQDGCKVYVDSYVASNGSCFMVTWTVFKNHLVVDMLVFPSPTGYLLLTSFSFSSLNWVYSIDSSKMIGSFPYIINFDHLFLKLNWVH